MLSTAFSQSLLDEDCSTSRNNVSQSPSLSSLGGRERQSSFTTQADIDFNPIFYTVIKPVLDGKDPNQISSDTQWNGIGCQHDSMPQSNDHITSLQDPSDRSEPAATARTPFLYHPPGYVSCLRRFDSVSSLNTEGSFYQRGRLDDLLEREESEDMEDHTEYEWHGSDNAHYEGEIGDDSTEITSAMSRTVTPSVSREQSFSSASSFEGYEASQSGYDTESLVGGYQSRDTTPNPSHFSSSWETYHLSLSRSQSPSSASAFGGNQGSQSGYDTEPVDEPSAWNYESRDTTPTPFQPTGTMPSFPCASLSAPVRASSVPAPVTSPSRYNTRSGQIPGSYVAKTGTPRRRRAGGESISATPYEYTRKDKKGH